MKCFSYQNENDITLNCFENWFMKKEFCLSDHILDIVKAIKKYYLSNQSVTLNCNCFSQSKTREKNENLIN